MILVSVFFTSFTGFKTMALPPAGAILQTEAWVSVSIHFLGATLAVKLGPSAPTAGSFSMRGKDFCPWPQAPTGSFSCGACERQMNAQLQTQGSMYDALIVTTLLAWNIHTFLKTVHGLNGQATLERTGAPCAARSQVVTSADIPACLLSSLLIRSKDRLDAMQACGC